jgi:hypothetical protein
MRRSPLAPLRLVLCLILCLALPQPCLACFGARPLAMGGAFVAVADDYHATYWNPAGLTKVPSPEVGGTFDTDWQDLNYDVFVGAAAPITGVVGAGLLYVYNEDDLGLGLTARDHFVQAAVGALVLPWGGWRDSPVTLSVGLAGKYVNSGFEAEGFKVSDGTWDLDVSFLLDAGPVVGPRQRMFSLGVLVQNVLESGFDFGPLGKQTYVANVRPAVAFRPDGLTTLSLEIYDAFERASGEPGVRLGAERWVTWGAGRPWLALRAGGYHINQAELRAATFGVGVRPTPQVELAYALLYWTEQERTTHLLAASYYF